MITSSIECKSFIIGTLGRLECLVEKARLEMNKGSDILWLTYAYLVSEGNPALADKSDGLFCNDDLSVAAYDTTLPKDLKVDSWWY